MQNFAYKTMRDKFALHRREFLKAGGIVSAGLVLGNPL
ncbi:MAG: twin-arginine translocation signal domain-containing protein, partial [candidate division Zixibacteria bacterium]|nr:twin-arginine translocation signal domain-containing protein [candidate division Zixibacteria bacterium]